MRLIAYFITALVLANIVAATFVWPPEASVAPAPIVNAATRRGQEPWMANEGYLADSRARTRKGTLRTLDQPWSTWCTADGHTKLIEAISYYYYQRDGEAWSKAHTYGEEGRRFAINAWTTADDLRIERLASEAHDNGYISLDELRPYARKPPIPLVRSAKVRPKPCAN